MATYGTVCSDGITWTVPTSAEPARVSRALIATRAVELKDGWTGQVSVNGRIVAEKGGFGLAAEAERWASKRVVKRLRKLLS